MPFTGPRTAPALGLRAGSNGAFILPQIALERRPTMFFSSWLRSRKSSQGPRRQGSSLAVALRCRPRLEALEDRWLPSTLTVTSPLDDGSSGTLRSTIAAAANGDTIVFDNSLYGQTVTLNGSELLINKALTIQGLGADHLAISGNHLSRVFEVYGSPFTLAGLTIEYGNSGPSGNYGPLTNGRGGGIYSEGVLTASNCIFSSNSSAGSGGAIAEVNDPLTLTGCIFSGNTALDGSGGAIFKIAGGVGSLELSLSGCTLSGNSAHYHNQPILNQTGCGGAIYTGAATTKLTACTLSGNSAGSGGAIFSTQDKGNSLTLSGCTITSNTATSKGGGIYIYAGDAFVQNTSITNNSAGAQGGGIFNDVNGRLTLYDSSVVSGNSAPEGADIDNFGHILRKKG
jgi:predicted outer membrane repeat protein